MVKMNNILRQKRAKISSKIFIIFVSSLGKLKSQCLYRINLVVRTRMQCLGKSEFEKKLMILLYFYKHLLKIKLIYIE